MTTRLRKPVSRVTTLLCGFRLTPRSQDQYVVTLKPSADGGVLEFRRLRCQSVYTISLESCFLRAVEAELKDRKNQDWTHVSASWTLGIHKKEVTK